MFKARIKNTEEIIEADDLKAISNVSLMEFVCVDKSCNIPLIASSYKESNIRRPFFKKYRNQHHSDKCTYGQYLQLIEIGKTRRLTELEFEKLNYPSKLKEVVPIKKETDSTTSDDLPDSEKSGTRKVSSGEFTEAANSDRTVTSLSQIVDFYLSCPYNRDVELDLLGSSAPYKFQFRRIFGENEGDYLDNKIFYGIIDLDSLGAIRSEGDYTIIKLHECENWVESKTKSLFKRMERVNQYSVRINNNEISKHKLTRIMKERETVANQSKYDFLNHMKKEKTEAYIFFLGKKPKSETPYVFDAIKGFVSFRYTKILKNINE